MESDGGDKQSKMNTDGSFSGRTSNDQPTGSSVWNLCSIPSDIHAVDLRDITPSLSPVFTEDQVRELSGQTGDLDVLGDNFLHHDTFKRITEVLSPEQTNMLISTCSSLCNESGVMSYTEPIGHFSSQHVSLLNTPHEKTPAMDALNSDTGKTELDGKQESKGTKSREPSKESGSVVNTAKSASKNANKNAESPAKEKEDSTANDCKTKTGQVKSSYSLRSSPRKAAKEEKPKAETPTRTTRQKKKEQTPHETERRKSPRGQKQTPEKEETANAVSDTKPQGRRGKQKQEQKQPDQLKKEVEEEEEEEEKKDEGRMNLRRLELIALKYNFSLT